MIAEQSTETVVIPKPQVEEPEAEKAQEPTALKTSTRRGRLARFVRVGAGVWVGLLFVAGGFGLIVYTWSKVAALLDVALQLPYIVSGGLTGIGLVLFGLLVTNLSVRRREALERSRQLDEVREALVRLRSAVEGTDE